MHLATDRKHAWLPSMLILVVILAVSCLSGHAETIRFWAVTGSPKDTEMYRKVAATFKRDTGIHVEITPLAWGDFKTKYFAAMSAGLPPDVGVSNINAPFDYGAVGGVINLSKTFPVETKSITDQLPSSLINAMKIDGDVYGIPSDLGCLVIYYRTDTFKALGISPPKTWQELNTVIDLLEANGYHYYFGWTYLAQWASRMYTLPFGIAGISRVNSSGKATVNWNNPEYQRGISWMLSLWHMHNNASSDMAGRAVGLFRANDRDSRTPLLIDLHNKHAQITLTAPELRGKWSTIPWPVADGQRPYHIAGGTTFVIFSQSKHQQSSMRWITYLNSLEVQQEITTSRLNRGDESALTINPNEAFWNSSNDAFWNAPERLSHRSMATVIRQILPFLGTLESIPGAVETDRLEGNLLDTAGGWIRDKMRSIATKKGLRREELVQGFASGQYAAERTALQSALNLYLKSKYADAQPVAQKIIDREDADFVSKRLLSQKPGRGDALSVIKIVVGLIIAVAICLPLVHPGLRRHTVSYLFILPPLLLAAIFVLIPALTALYQSFTEYHPVLPLATARFVGVQNYKELLVGSELMPALGRTLQYAVISLPLGIGIALVLSFLLTSKPIGEKLWRFVYFSPLVTSVVSISLIFYQLFLGSKQGWLNTILLTLRLVQDPVPFLTDERTFLGTVIVLAVWHGLAFTILVFVAGLQQVPKSMYEAADLDGAGPFRQFLNVAIPGIQPQIMFASVLGLIGSFQVFEAIYTLSSKSSDAQARFGPNDSALTIVPLIYHKGFETYEMGMAAASAYVLFGIILLLTLLQLRLYRKLTS